MLDGLSNEHLDHQLSQPSRDDQDPAARSWEAVRLGELLEMAAGVPVPQSVSQIPAPSHTGTSLVD